MTSIYNKTAEKDFTKVPNPLFQLYTRLPGFKGQHAFLWTVLRNYHNDAYGYAFPSQDQLAADMNTSAKTIGGWLGVLEEYNLIKIIPRQQGSGDHNKYVLYMPIADKDEFIAAYPETAAIFKRQVTHKEARRVQRDENMKKASAKHVAADQIQDPAEMEDISWI